MYGQLLAVAAYHAAIRDDRDAARTLLAEVEQPAHADGTSTRFNTTELAVYRIGVARNSATTAPSSTTPARSRFDECPGQRLGRVSAPTRSATSRQW
jgi:hypothetical protein